MRSAINQAGAELSRSTIFPTGSRRSHAKLTSQCGEVDGGLDRTGSPGFETA